MGKKMESEYLQFFEVMKDKGESYGEAEKRRTKRIAVYSLKKHEYLGRIKWHFSWRQYVFEPKENTVLSAQCLDDIKQFIKCLMKKRKVVRHETQKEA